MDDFQDLQPPAPSDADHLDDLLRRELRHPKYNPIGREEEMDLVIRAKGGDVHARNRLFEANLRLVAKYATKSSGADRSDVFQEGALALYEALKYFDPSKGFRFSSFLAMPVRQAMGKLVAADRSAPACENVRAAFRKIEKLKDAQEAIGEPADAATLARLSGKSIEYVLRALAYLAGDAALNLTIVDGDGETLERQDLVEDEYPFADPAELLSFVEERLDADLDEALSWLSPEQRRVFDLEYGLHGRVGMSREEIARELGLSKTQVAGLVMRAMKKLRRWLPEPAFAASMT